MRCPPDTGSGHSAAWQKLLLIGTLTASCTCSAPLELPLSAPLQSSREGASARPPVPGGPGGLLAASRSTIFSPEGRPGPAHRARESLGARGSLPSTNGTARLLDTSGGQRRATRELRVNNSPRRVPLRTYPSAIRGTIYSDLNFSVILEWVITMDPEPELTWALNGRLCGTGEKLFIRRLSPELLGTYVCTGRNSEQLLSSDPVTISLPPEPQVDVDPTPAWPVQPDPGLSLSGGSAIALVVAASVGGVTLLGVAVFYCLKELSSAD